MRNPRRSALWILLVVCCLLEPAVAQEEHPFDPFRAEKNVEIGEFYMRKKNYDAAIERFKESIRYKPNFALPHRLLGEAYEKKGEKGEALEFYKKYLQVQPSASDAGKIRKRIERLSRDLEWETTRRKRALD